MLGFVNSTQPTFYSLSPPFKGGLGGIIQRVVGWVKPNYLLLIIPPFKGGLGGIIQRVVGWVKPKPYLIRCHPLTLATETFFPKS